MHIHEWMQFRREYRVLVLGLLLFLCVLLGFRDTRACIDPMLFPAPTAAHLDVPPTSDYGYTLSASVTDPFVHAAAPVAGIVNVYLWLACSPEGGVAAIEFSIDHDFPFLVGIQGNQVNFGSLDHPRLSVRDCPTAAVPLATLQFLDPTGAGGSVCLTPHAATGFNRTANCALPIPATFPNFVKGFSSDGSAVCVSPGGLCGQDAVALTVTNYQTFGSTTGQTCACGLAIPPGLRSSNIVSVDGVPGFNFVPSANTAASLNGQMTGNWTGFMSTTTADVPPGTPVDLVFDLTRAAGATISEVATALQGCLVGTDEADATGVITGGHLSIVPPIVPVSAQPTIAAPTAFALYPAVPNPLTGSTSIRFALPHASQVDVRVFDVAGRLVRILEDGSEKAAGIHASTWDGQNEDLRQVVAGIYFVELTTREFRKTQKLTVVR
jgi:hypothetical protein